MSSLHLVIQSYSVMSHLVKDSVNFVEFLHLMRHLLDVNFAGIAELSTAAASAESMRSSIRASASLHMF